MSKRTPWYPASVKPVREGWYEWRCRTVTKGTVHAQWGDGDWLRSTGQTLFTPKFKCDRCQWRGLTRPAEE